MPSWISRIATFLIILSIFGLSIVSYNYIWTEIGGSPGLRERILVLLDAEDRTTQETDESVEISQLSYSQISGDSMEPTLQDGETYLSIPPELYAPQIGDMVSFRCINDDRCFDLIPPEIRDRDGLNQDIYLVKRWVRTEPDGCMHLEGDNKANSWDTRSFGCVYPDDIEIFATVWKNT